MVRVATPLSFRERVMATAPFSLRERVRVRGRV
jgi:hypothetical protein